MSLVSGGDLLQEAAAELYSSDPDEFIEHRGILAARARAAGDAPAAKGITGLRKPTRSAWVLNQLARAEPGLAAQLAGLGAELRAAQRSLDGATIRELSQRRRQLIDALARQAFTVSGLHAPPAALRDEVTATLGAALADPQVAEQLAAGILVRAARRDGFGSAGAAVLTLVPPPAASRREPAAKAAAVPAGPAASTTAVTAGRARAERQRRQAIAEAEHAAAQADRAADTAAAAEREQENAVRLLEEQLADARRGLADIRLRARQAAAARRRARLALDRLRDEPPPAAVRPAKR